MLHGVGATLPRLGHLHHRLKSIGWGVRPVASMDTLLEALHHILALGNEMGIGVLIQAGLEYLG